MANHRKNVTLYNTVGELLDAKRREAIKARISRHHSVRGQNRTVAPLTPEQISEKYADRRRTGKTRRESELRGRAAVAV